MPGHLRSDADYILSRAPDYVLIRRQAEEREVLRWLAEQLGAPEPRAAEPGEKPAGSKRCSSRRLRESGYRFTYPTFREGYAALLAAEGGSPR